MGAARYSLGEELGRGGLGIVRAAVDVTLGREVAIKSVRRERSSHATSAFVEEAQVTGQLEHPNIVPVHELGVDEQGELYLAMKRVRGRTLREIIRDSHRRAAADAVRETSRLLEVFLKVCDAIAYAHSRGVIHRDLKPDNIMVGAFGEVLVMDWGLARPLGTGVHPDEPAVATSRRSEGTNVTRDGAIVGTPSFMAPEQARGRNEEVAEGADIYALGAILYTMLVGRPPFGGDNHQHVAQLLSDVARGSFDPPVEAGGSRPVPRELDAVVMRAMARRAEDRYVSVSELAADVRAYLDGRTLQAADYSLFQILGKWARRNKAAVVGTASTALALVIGLVVVVWLVNRAEVDRLLAIEETRERERAEHDKQATVDFDAGCAAWEAADQDARLAFNPAAPQAWFRSRVPALLSMGRAFRNHSSPPPDWANAINMRAADVERLALQVNDWAMARVVADQLAAWNAVPQAEVDARIQAIIDDEQAAIRHDADAVESALDRIAAATASVPGEEGKWTDPDRRPAFAAANLQKGELTEWARRLATRGESRGITRATLRYLTDGASLNRFQRQLLIDTLGRRGDVLTRFDGLSAPQLISEAINRATANPDPQTAGEVRLWVMAAARLAAGAPDAFGGEAALADLLARLVRAWNGATPIQSAVADADRIQDVATGSPLARPDEDSLGYRRDLEWLHDHLASCWRAEAPTTARLLGLAREAWRGGDGPWEQPRVERLGFILDLLGAVLGGVTGSASQDARAAVGIMREVADLPEGWYADEVPAGVRPDIWTARRTLAQVAWENLSRIGDRNAGWDLYQRLRPGLRLATTERLRLALTLAPIPDWQAIQPDLFQKAHFLLEARHMDAMRDALSQLDDLSDVRRNPEYWKCHGELQVARGNWGDAESAFRQMLALEPKRVDAAWMRLVRVYVSSQRWSEAVAAAHHLLELNPGNGLAVTARGYAQANLGNPDAGIADLRRAAALRPDDSTTLVWLAEVLRENGQYEEALAVVDGVLATDPEDASLWLMRGTIREYTNGPEAAVDDLTRAIELDPANKWTWALRGGPYLALGDARSAEADLRHALRLDPDFPKALVDCSNVLRVAGRPQEALRMLERANEINPGSATVLVNRAGIMLDLGRLDDALADADAAVAADPELASGHLQRGQVLERLVRLDEAIAAYRRAIALDPVAREPRYLLARQLAQRHDYAAAREHVAEMVRYHPTFVQGWRLYGAIHYVSNDLAGFARASQRVIELGAGTAEDYHDGGAALLALGRTQEALDLLDAGVRAFPDVWFLWMQLGTTAAAAGNRTVATRSFDRARAICPPANRREVDNARRQALGR